jgi:thymidylate kinase
MVLAWFDALYEFGFRVRKLLMDGHTVICDRYLVDAWIDMRLRFPEHHWAHVAFERLAMLCPSPRSHFLLSLTYEEVERRATIKQEPFPDTDVLRRHRYREYHELARYGKLINVDASREPHCIHEEILDRIRNY